MSLASDGGAGRPNRVSDRGAMVVIAICGIGLGLAHNALGLEAGRGLPWVAGDPLAQLAGAPVVGGADSGDPAADPYATNVSDPLAVPAGGTAGGGLPEIPAVGRPVQIGTAALREYVDAGAALVVDARDGAEYEEGHIRGALSLPYDEVATDRERLERLDTGGRPVVVYCGGGTCETSLRLAHEMIFAGHARVAVYIDGFPAWSAGGHPTESGRGGAATP